MTMIEAKIPSDTKDNREGELSENQPGPSAIWLTVSDVRQWTFCPRVLWHQRMMPHRVRETPKMQLGRDAQSALERLERRRAGKRYGLDMAERRFNVPLSSEPLCVRGFCDLVLESPERDDRPRKLFPVEVKRTEGGASQHHAIQLAGYAMLIEDQEGLAPGCINRGFLLLLPEDRLVPIDLGADLRTAFQTAITDIRTMLEREKFPDPTKHRSFCPQCEYIHFCGDVL